LRFAIWDWGFGIGDLGLGIWDWGFEISNLRFGSMKLGVGSYAFAWAIGVPGHPPARPLDAFGFLERAAGLGVRLVQICDNLPMNGLSAGDVDRLLDRGGELGLEFEWGTWGLDAENLRFCLGLVRRCEGRFLRVVIDRAGDEPTAEEAVARLRPLLPEFAGAGVRLAIENHDRFRSRTLAWMVEELGPEHVGICLDTVNSFGALEGPEQVVGALGRYTLSLHVKDFRIRRVSHRMGFELEGCAAGQGQLGVPWLLGELKSCPNPFNAVVETWVSPGGSLEETIARELEMTEAGVRYMRGLVTD
jgi:3-oxoisoapionate decarboxylase